jgi:hypothetical protein
MTNTAIIKGLAERIEREAPAVLEGWKLVPVEPTQAMVDAYLAANLQYWKTTDELPTPPNRWRTGTASAATCESYRAMLAAAPQQAPQAKSDAEKLATAIAEAATRAGITDSKIHGFSGPQLLMLLDDLIELAITKPLPSHNKPHVIATNLSCQKERGKRSGLYGLSTRNRMVRFSTTFAFLFREPPPLRDR